METEYVGHLCNSLKMCRLATDIHTSSHQQAAIVYIYIDLIAMGKCIMFKFCVPVYKDDNRSIRTLLVRHDSIDSVIKLHWQRHVMLSHQVFII